MEGFSLLNIDTIQPREVTSPNLYLYVWFKFGEKWVPFQFILEQEGYADMGMSLMSFSNVGTISSIQMKQQHVYTISDAWTGLTFLGHTC